MHDLDVLGNVPAPLAALLDSPDKRVRDGARNSGMRLWRALGIACDRTGHAEESQAELSLRAHLPVGTMRRWLARFEAWGIVVAVRRGTGTRAGNVATRYLLPGLMALLLRLAVKLRAKLLAAANNALHHAKLTNEIATTARKVVNTPRERVGSDRKKPNKRSGSGDRTHLSMHSRNRNPNLERGPTGKAPRWPLPTGLQPDSGATGTGSAS